MRMSVRIALVVGVVTTLGLFSCEKEFTERSCVRASEVECGEDSNKVNVRVSNFTGYPLCDFNMIYRKDEGTIYDYGTLDVEALSCYTTLDFAAVYPEITFNLGTGKFTIPDTLLNDDKWSSQKQTTPGFYTYLIQTAFGLDSQRVVSFMIVEDQ